MFMKTEKRRKHKGFAIAIGALAMYGAYSVIKGAKDMCMGRISAMASCIGKMKKKKKGMAEEVCPESEACAPCDGCEEEPYD